MARTNGAAPVMQPALSRAIAAAFWLATAAYCLLCAVPFSWEQFLKPGLVPALVAFADWHAWVSLAALVATATGLRFWLWSGRRGVQALIATWSAATAAFFSALPLSALEPSPRTLAVALLSLLPPIWISMMDLRSAESTPPAESDPNADDVWRDFAACALAAVFVMMIHAVGALPYVLRIGTVEAAIGSAQSLLLHLLVFAAVFALVSIIRGGSRLISRPSAVEAWLARAALALALAVFIFQVVLRPLSLVGGRAYVVAGAFGVALAATFGPRSTSAGPGLVRALGGMVPERATRSLPAAAIWLCLVAAIVVAIEWRAATTDWNFAVAKSAALVSWLLALAVTLRALPAGQPGRGGALVFAACFAILGLQVAASRLFAGSASISDAWKARDPSVRLIADALAPPAAMSVEGLVDFLQRHTNIPRNVKVEPVAIDLARLAGVPSPARPHIFLFVIDSLRRDYLSPYRRDVTFTPAFDRFARESVVFERAFTRYGATGLSVPALWVGGLVLHKQYVTPFGPMNSLAKLLEHEQYDQWISMDNILDVILPPSPRRTPLDATIQVADYRLCATLTEIRSRLDRLGPDEPPTFVYSLPQDIHVSTISREGGAPVDSESYGSFHAPYASRVRRMDACFGAFIDDLKGRGLFDRSIVVVTSDHGDSLGEDGRMGHAYTLFPEIVQVPLIVHLPSSLAARLHGDTSAPAFTTDVTPTLYALLGHEPQPAAAFFGRPLFRRDESRAPPLPAEPEMVASSYGSVYGALLDNARRLYVIDAIDLREYSYVVDGSGAGQKTAVVDADRARSQQAIRATVESIAQFYGYRQ